MWKLALIGFAFAGAGWSQPSSAAAGKVVKLEGSLSRRSVDANGAKSLETLKVGSFVEWENVLVTGAKSRATILLEGQAALLLNSNSTLKIKKQKGGPSQLELTAGGLLSLVKSKPAPKGKESFQVKTPAAVIGVRGTTFFVQTEKDKPDYLCACYGKVSLSSGLKPDGELLESDGHQARRRISAETGAKPTDEVLGHSEEDIALLKTYLK